jgi:hypothetical protein
MDQNTVDRKGLFFADDYQEAIVGRGQAGHRIGADATDKAVTEGGE